MACHDPVLIDVYHWQVRALAGLFQAVAKRSFESEAFVKIMCACDCRACAGRVLVDFVPQ